MKEVQDGNFSAFSWTRSSQKSGLFSGAPDYVVPLHCVEAVTNNKFLVIGKMLATCLVQGGQAPACFAQAVADFIVYDCIRSPVCLEDIADYEVRSNLEKVHQNLVFSVYGSVNMLDKIIWIPVKCIFTSIDWTLYFLLLYRSSSPCVFHNPLPSPLPTPTPPPTSLSHSPSSPVVTQNR